MSQAMKKLDLSEQSRASGAGEDQSEVFGFSIA
jgi:hypothetical protein